MKNWKAILALSLSITICLNVSASANEPLNLAPPDSEKVAELLRSCDAALGTCQKLNNEKDNLIESQKSVIDAQAKELGDKREAESSILNNKVIWFVVGVLTTAVTVHLIRK